MSDKENKKPELEGAEKHKKNIIDMIGGMAGIERYIEGFDNSTENKMTDAQKQSMKTYAVGVAEKWSETIFKIEKALSDPNVVKDLEKKLKTAKVPKKQE